MLGDFRTGPIAMPFAALLLALAATIPSPPTAATAAAPIATEAVTSAAPATTGLIRANTVIVLEPIDPVSSKLQLRGDTFRLRLAEPILDGDRVLMPAGTIAYGEVIHAQKASGGGRAGELSVAARYLDTPRGQIKLRSSFGSAGEDHTKAALATSFIAGPFAMMVQGSERILPAGTRVNSKTALDTDLATLTPTMVVSPTAPAPAIAPADAAIPAVPVTPTLSNPEGSSVP
jgi:hypothetical protein